MTYNEDYAGQEADLVPGTLRGFREWQGVHGGLLASLSMSYVWQTATERAVCLKTHRAQINDDMSLEIYRARGIMTEPEHQVPKRSCTCGIYARHKPERGYGRRYLAGVIEGYGRVEVGSEGFRSEKARIVALAMPSIIMHEQYAEFMRIIGQRYGGVTFFPSNSAMWAAYPPIDVSSLIPRSHEPCLELLPWLKSLM